MRKLVALTALLLSIHFVLLTGQIKVSDVKLFTVADGLSQSSVNSILQDSKGFIWIGTNNGLNRFDGYEFVPYTHQPNDSNTLSNNFINAVCEDKSGLLWVATNNGLNCINLKTGKVKSFHHQTGKGNSLSDNTVLNVFTDKQGVLWIKTLKSLDKFNADKNNFTCYNHYNDVFYFTSSNIALPIVEDNNDQLWVGTKDGLNFFDKDLQLFKRYITLEYNKNSLSNNEIRCMTTDSDGKIWIGTAKGLNEFDAEKKIFYRYYIDKGAGSSVFNKINALLVGSEHLLWVGTQNGLLCFDLGSKSFIKPKVAEQEKLLDLPILSLTKDKSGIIWAGTYKGLMRLNTIQKKFQLVNANNKDLVLPLYDIGSVFSESNEVFWLGTQGKGLVWVNRKTNKVITYSSIIADNDRNSYINCIYKSSGDDYVLGTDNGILFFNKVSGKFHSLCDDEVPKGCEMLYQNKVNSVIEDSNNLLWIGTSYGLFGYNKSNKQISVLLNNPDDKNSICDDKVNVLLKDNENNIWVGTENGLDKFEPKSRIFSHFNLNSNGNTLFSSSAIYCLKFDLDGFLWVGTSTGLNRFNVKDKSAILLTEKEGLSDNSIFSIEVDLNNSVWVSTNRGLNKINSEDLSITNYDTNDGLQDYEFNRNASGAFKSGELIFGGISGINIFNPDSLFENNFVPGIEITSVEIITSSEKILWQSFDNGHIKVPHRAKVITINFASLDFTLPEKNNYAYKLFSVNEEEPDWINIGKKHSATFSSLKPGEYFFKVKGSNNDGVWNDKGNTITIKVESPFWMKPQAVYLYVFIGVIFLLGIYRYRTYSLRKTNKMLKDKELASLEVERQREQLAIKNKNITDSINYAKRIQEALMPSAKSIIRVLPESFVFHQPKDIVSGDFFWVSERGDKVFAAAVDCTGHGVPGAFMSIIGFELFRKITHNQGIENPAQILSILNKEFEEIFRDVDNYIMRDGMDIAFCVIDKKTKLLEYSGAVNPIYLIRDDKITEIVGSRFSVGLDSTPEDERGFENKQIVLQDDDVIYLFSDGYADQFGGPEGKKFKYRRFRHLLLTIHNYPMEEQHDLLAERINRWKGDFEQVDDMLIIGFKPTFN